VNVLVALLDRQHSSHASAQAWLAGQLANGWASCPLTENGCLRILTNPRYPAPVSAAEVLEKLAGAKASGHHEFWPDKISITDETHFKRRQLRGHQQVADVYLLALAVHHGGVLVTFDQGITLAAVPGARPEHLVAL
jgi:toxin-antitoxin system PIN domain toxin